jgi:hypothetical protein
VLDRLTASDRDRHAAELLPVAARRRLEYRLVLLLESVAFLALALLLRRTWMLAIAVTFVVARASLPVLHARASDLGHPGHSRGGAGDCRHCRPFRTGSVARHPAPGANVVAEDAADEREPRGRLQPPRAAH